MRCDATEEAVKGYNRYLLDSDFVCSSQHLFRKQHESNCSKHVRASYTVTNTARGMRSRLLDMKRFVSIFLTTGFDNEENARELLKNAIRCRMKRLIASRNAIWARRKM